MRPSRGAIRLCIVTLATQEAAMDLDEMLDEPELEFEDDEAEDWDEETLGLDWNEADERTVVRELTGEFDG
jgi:hypothetical protein